MIIRNYHGPNARTVKNEIDLSPFLKKLYISKNEDLLVILNKLNGFEFRINKKIYKTQENSLEFEIRFYDDNRKYFDGIVEFLNKNNYEYRTKFSPKLNLPKRIFINFKKSGLYGISSIQWLVKEISKYTTGQEGNEYLVGFEESFLWENNPHKKI